MSTLFTSGHTLSIGVGADLPNTVNNAGGLADMLKDEGRCACPTSQVHLLTDEDTARDNLLAALDNLAKSTDAQSTVVVYFFGHGYQVHSTTGESYYLMPYGYDLNQLYKTAISSAEFIGKLKAIPAQKLLLLLDCCHASAGLGSSHSTLRKFWSDTSCPPLQSYL